MPDRFACAGAPSASPEATGRDAPEPVALAARIRQAAEQVRDPEMPAVCIGDLGMVRSVRCDPDGQAEVVLRPTFVGCPALGAIEQEVRRQVGRLAGVQAVRVRWTLEPVWTVADVTEAGWRSLRASGIARPLPGGPACPYCGSRQSVLDNLFGPAACRSLHYCTACRNPFESIKAIGGLPTQAPRGEGDP